MTIKEIRSDDIYRKMLSAPPEKRDDIFRYELMSPFQYKWDCYHIPLKAAHPGGYDIIMACRMMGLLVPSAFTGETASQNEMLADDCLWQRCRGAIERSLALFEKDGIDMPVKEYVFSLLLADESNAFTVMNGNYCGDGGIPGYIMAWLVPGEDTLHRVHAALAHETNHNVRFQYLKWHDDITLGEMMVSEGLAENFAVSLYGEELAGPWVTKTRLDGDICKKIHSALRVRGLEQLNAYLYGDELAQMQGYFPVGLPYCAGYTCGYQLIKHFLKKTGMSITQATIMPAEDILKCTEDFWDDK